MNRKEIIDTAEAKFEDNKDDCNKFLKAVADKLNVDLPIGEDANGLFDHMERSPQWKPLGKGAPGMDLALHYALNGSFVVAAMKEKGDGHVAVIVGEDIDGTPTAYWGQLGGAGQKRGRLSASWARKKFPTISYFAYIN